MACDVATWRDELDALIVNYGLMCAFGSSEDMMKAKAKIERHVDALFSDGVAPTDGGQKR